MNRFHPKFGKLPAQHGAVKLKMASYVDLSKLPPIPDSFGDTSLVKDWGMLANDHVANCVFAGGAHETMLECAIGKREVHFDDAGVLSDYSAVTGYVSTDPGSDRGTRVFEALKYRRDTGLIDAFDKRHQIGAFLALEPGNTDQMRAALFLFKTLGVGLAFPGSAMMQFNAGQAWDVVSQVQPHEGHYVPLMSWQPGAATCVTWGRPQQMTERFLETYCDEAYAILSDEMLDDNGKSPEGFDREQLLDDLSAM